MQQRSEKLTEPLQEMFHCKHVTNFWKANSNILENFIVKRTCDYAEYFLQTFYEYF